MILLLLHISHSGSLGVCVKRSWQGLHVSGLDFSAFTLESPPALPEKSLSGPLIFSCLSGDAEVSLDGPSPCLSASSFGSSATLPKSPSALVAGAIVGTF